MFTFVFILLALCIAIGDTGKKIIKDDNASPIYMLFLFIYFIALYLHISNK